VTDLLTAPCLLSSVVTPAAFEGLEVLFNSVLLTVAKRWNSDEWRLEGSIPGSAAGVHAHIARLTFSCPVMRRPGDVHPASADQRTLGVALGRIRID
jgi:hypothetical protein